jgi:hypothetical protein
VCTYYFRVLVSADTSKYTDMKPKTCNRREMERFTAVVPIVFEMLMAPVSVTSLAS